MSLKSKLSNASNQIKLLLSKINSVLWTAAAITIAITAGGSTLLAIYYTLKGVLT